MCYLMENTPETDRLHRMRAVSKAISRMPWSTCIIFLKKIVQLGYTLSWTFFIYFLTEQDGITDTNIYLRKDGGNPKWQVYH